MATYGIEAIRYFDKVRTALNKPELIDLIYTFDRSGGFDAKLRSAGHSLTFYLTNDYCQETDIRSADLGGEDRKYVDNVDICWFETHGEHTLDKGEIELFFNTTHTYWIAYSSDWKLGDQRLNWLLVYGCETVDRNKVPGIWSMFNGMHIYCGAWGKMWDSPTTNECGEDVGEYLISGSTVSDAWTNGVTDWLIDNHPITVCVGDSATWNNGNIQWERSYLNRDHLYGHGNVDPSLTPAQQACIMWRWAEG